MLGKIINHALAAPSADRLQSIAQTAEYNTAQSFSPAILIVNIITYVLGFVGLIFLIMILWSGTKMIFAGGNEQEIDEAKTRLKNAVIGFIVIVLAFTILMFVRATVLTVL